MTYTTDNRLATCNGQSVIYDADGNMTSGPLNSQTTSFTFDSRNRLTAAGSTTYSYDAENNRISAAGSAYVINPNASLSQVLIQIDGQGNQTFYVYGLGLIGEQSSAGYKVYHYDLRGSTVMLTDMNGTMTDTYQYGPYGESLNHSGNSTTPFQYNGQYGIMNDGNGLYYMRARYYNPEIKRFVSKDSLIGSITKPQTLNRYGFVNSDPIIKIDPKGNYGDSVHYGNERGGTIKICSDMGIYSPYAKAIAEGDVAVDYGASSAANTRGLAQSRYFDRNPTCDDSRQNWADECMKEALRVWKEGMDAYKEGIIDHNEFFNWCCYACRILGKGLHSLQDIDGHGDYGTEDMINPIEWPHHTEDHKYLPNLNEFDDPKNDIYRDDNGNWNLNDSGSEFGSNRYAHTIEITKEYISRFFQQAYEEEWNGF